MLVKVARAGLNFADTHQRQDQYIGKQTLPLVPGAEVAGVREDTGERVVALCGYRRLRGVRGRAGATAPSRSPTASTTAPRSRCSSRA